METNNDDKIKKLMKTAYPQIMALARDKVCPSEEALASFAEGKLKGKKEEQVISHLAFCEDCLEMIKFLRQVPSAEEVSVPLWLEETARSLFPEKPKTWEIVVGHFKTALEVLKHTAGECWTIPTLELIPARIKLEPPYLHSRYEAKGAYGLIFSDEKTLPKRPSTRRLFKIAEHGPRVRGSQPVEPKRTLPEEVVGRSAEAEMSTDYRWAASAPVSAAKDKILKSLRERISSGFVFVEPIGPYNVYLTITKREDKRPEIFEVEIEVYGRSGRFVEEIEVSFIQGRRTIEKSVTRKKTGISKRLSPKKYSIKFNHKGIYLGQALLDLREGKPEQSGQWD